MEIPDNWLDEICKGCDLKDECEAHDTLCKCSEVLYEMVSAVEKYIEE